MPRPGLASRTRAQAVERLTDVVLEVEAAHPLRVAIDGVDGAGKTTLADELVEVLHGRGRHCIRASIDGFHRPRAERYRRGRASPEGYYLDSFDLLAVRDELLDPLGPGGSRRYRPRVFDHRSDRAVSAAMRIAPQDAIVLVDGIFLLRPELAGLRDLSVFVDADPASAVRNAIRRDSAEGTDEVASLYRTRYLPAQRRYLEELRPHQEADVIFVNEDPSRPRLIVRRRVR